MPTLTETQTTAWAFCRDGRCIGYLAAEVPATQTTTSIAYAELGGDMPGIERSFDRLAFEDPGDVACPSCGKDRELSLAPRPEYPATSGQDPMLLLHLGKTDGRVRELEHQAEIDKLRRDRELSELKAQVDELKGLLVTSSGERLAEAVAEPPVKRGPGRPPKQPQGDGGA